MLDDPAGGQVSIVVDLSGNTTATYECNEGYELLGDRVRICQANSQWSGSDSTCQSEWL